ncbi:MAG: hypothetical protein ACR2HM_08500 [Acidimicrobiales bacterium]
MRTIERALRLGGAGFFGSWLVDLLAAEGIETVLVDISAAWRSCSAFRRPRTCPAAPEPRLVRDRDYRARMPTRVSAEPS